MQPTQMRLVFIPVPFSSWAMLQWNGKDILCNQWVDTLIFWVIKYQARPKTVIQSLRK
jgi:hypothetical protein